ncbi:hypothetical protein NLU13_5935 [Sarocladium strictum]|uniref:Uncharacterized protein n=1 Tax=Sarocladium strictum TaxID=5046 RepID=A0AA39GG86_SARSR|nr:hypothetical protein NLU13_5935 [Sarocladium strictum]
MAPNTHPDATFASLYAQLRTHPKPLLLPARPLDDSLSHQISHLLVHPTLEAALHLLNHDLPSAHFLVRHMQAAPKHEGMYLHGILHRIEGDYENARAWYSDVSESDVFTSIWGEGAVGLDKAKDFIQRVQDFKSGQQDEGTRGELEKESMLEIEKVVEFCREKFGTEKWEDASGAWKQPTEGKVKDMKEDMLTGDKGLRKF